MLDLKRNDAKTPTIPRLDQVLQIVIQMLVQFGDDFQTSLKQQQIENSATTAEDFFHKEKKKVLFCSPVEHVYHNLFETVQTLFWAVFGLIDLDSFELNEIRIFTRFWGMLMFGTYSVINIVVLLNLLIAMMNHSYQLISERADTEWKFARSKLWISYFEEGGTVPPPFNIIPTPKSGWYIIQWLRRKFCGSRAAKKEHMRTIRNISALDRGQDMIGGF
ncbi:hypothetical protein HUJ05_009482 [Dendroctonus ponderosae]|nr:hypothetical protein HUJ05_009482 [Dendroctonus ponderosae]